MKVNFHLVAVNVNFSVFVVMTQQSDDICLRLQESISVQEIKNCCSSSSVMMNFCCCYFYCFSCCWSVEQSVHNSIWLVMSFITFFQLPSFSWCTASLNSNLTLELTCYCHHFHCYDCKPHYCIDYFYYEVIPLCPGVTKIMINDWIEL